MQHRSLNIKQEIVENEKNIWQYKWRTHLEKVLAAPEELPYGAKSEKCWLWHVHSAKERTLLKRLLLPLAMYKMSYTSKQIYTGYVQSWLMLARTPLVSPAWFTLEQSQSTVVTVIPILRGTVFQTCTCVVPLNLSYTSDGLLLYILMFFVFFSK